MTATVRLWIESPLSLDQCRVRLGAGLGVGGAFPAGSGGRASPVIRLKENTVEASVVGPSSGSRRQSWGRPLEFRGQLVARGTGADLIGQTHGEGRWPAILCCLCLGSWPFLQTIALIAPGDWIVLIVLPVVGVVFEAYPYARLLAPERAAIALVRWLSPALDASHTSTGMVGDRLESLVRRCAGTVRSIEYVATGSIAAVIAFITPPWWPRGLVLTNRGGFVLIALLVVLLGAVGTITSLRSAPRPASAQPPMPPSMP